MYCGVLLKPPGKEEVEDTEIDWENRILCSDGSCTGTIEKGSCTVCGMPSPENGASN